MQLAFDSANDLERALHRAAAAHRQHEQRIGRCDERWPSWYAQYFEGEQTGEDVWEILRLETPKHIAFASASDLERALQRAAAAHAEHERQIGCANVDWQSWYARYLECDLLGPAERMRERKSA